MPPLSPDAPQQPHGSASPDPINGNHPQYNATGDPQYDPRWQRDRQRFLRDQQRANQNQARAMRRAQTQAYKAQARAAREQWKLYWRGQRRTSIIGPVLLIAVGVVFYLVHTGRLETLRFFNWYAHWWPVLLIAIGLLRMAEWVFDRSRQPQGAFPPRYTMGGGVVFAVIVLSCLGFALHAGGQWHADGKGVGFLMRDWSGGDHMNSFFGEKHEEDLPPIAKQIAPGALLSIDNPHGDVTVAGTSDDGRLHLSAHKEVFTNSDAGAAERLRNLTPTLQGSDSALTLSVARIDAGGADLTVLVPAGTRVVLNSDHGDVNVSNLKSPVTITANNGNVEVAAISSAVNVHVSNRRRDLNLRSIDGNVTVDGNGDEVTLSDVTGAVTIRGDFYSGGHLQHINGPVEYHSSRSDITLARLAGELQIDGHDLSASEVVGPMLVNTRSRNVTLDRVTGDIKVVNSHGDVDIHAAPPTGSITVDNQNGSVTLSLPSQAKFTLSAETSDGDAHSDFSTADTHGGRGILNGTVNGGGAEVHVNTSHGDIAISRNSETPLPSVSPRPPHISIATPTMETGSIGSAQLEKSEQDALAAAAAAVQQGTEQARNQSRQAIQESRERARDAMQQARDAMQQAREKQREAERLAREAQRNQP